MLMTLPLQGVSGKEMIIIIPQAGNMSPSTSPEPPSRRNGDRCIPQFVDDIIPSAALLTEQLPTPPRCTP